MRYLSHPSRRVCVMQGDAVYNWAWIQAFGYANYPPTVLELAHAEQRERLRQAAADFKPSRQMRKVV